MVKRRRGSRTARRLAPPLAGRHRRFEDLVDEALAGIPMPFAAALDEIAIVIDDEPSPEQLRESDLADDGTLYGLYEGVARTEYGADWIVAANSSPRRFPSTFPPDTTTTTRSPSRSGTLPDSTAASAAAPAGSTTCLR